MAALHKRALFRLMAGGSAVAFVPAVRRRKPPHRRRRSIRPSRPRSSGRRPPTPRPPTRRRARRQRHRHHRHPRLAAPVDGHQDATRRASSMRSRPRKWASSPTPTSPSRCSASPACRSTARTAKARSSRSAASARNITWSCSTAARCRPRSLSGDGGERARSSRSFDFANLASEGIAAVEVYKSGRATLPTGGIGSTINILTPRPLDRPGMRGSVSRARPCSTRRRTARTRSRRKFPASSATPSPTIASASC